jgi:hypothetical protein
MNLASSLRKLEELFAPDASGGLSSSKLTKQRNVRGELEHYVGG